MNIDQQNAIPLNKFFSCKEYCIYKSIKNFFTNLYEEESEVIPKFLNIILNHPLENLGLFLMNKFKNNNDLRIKHEAYLRTYTKRYFHLDLEENDKKFYVNIGNNQIYTSLGQLNYFVWIIKNNLID
jgi:hypothetical protein